MWCKSLTLEKYISFRMKWFFSPPFLSVSPFLLLNLVRRQCYAYAIGLHTRPEIKSWPDVKFCAHAHCVLPRSSCPLFWECWPFYTLSSFLILSDIRKVNDTSLHCHLQCVMYSGLRWVNPCWRRRNNHSPFVFCSLRFSLAFSRL